MCNIWGWMIGGKYWNAIFLTRLLVCAYFLRISMWKVKSEKTVFQTGHLEKKLFTGKISLFFFFKREMTWDIKLLITDIINNWHCCSVILKCIRKEGSCGVFLQTHSSVLHEDHEIQLKAMEKSELGTL